MRTNELRKMIQAKLLTLPASLGIEAVYYKLADQAALYPHLVFDVTGVNLGDLNRKDYTVDIDVITKSQQSTCDIGDSIEDMFNALNNPNSQILPTFFLVSRVPVEDPDKTIRREIVRLSVQLYDAE